MLNVIAIDGGEEYNQLLHNYFEELGINGLVFENFQGLYSWLDEKNDDQPFSFRFVLIAVQNSDDNAFGESLGLLEKFSSDPPVIIFMLKEHCDKSYIRALKYGAGYLLKPFGSDLLISAIHYHAKHAEINRLLGKKNKKLLEYKKTMDREHAIVESIFSNHFENHLIETDHIHFYISPASVFNGDVVLMAQGPGNTLYLAVGDVTGHGLPAAIGAMPVYATFRAMAKKGMAIGLIAYEMNKSLRTLLPDNMMMALTAMKIDYAEGTATIWSGGMPDVIVVDDKGDIVRKVGSRHSPLSMLEPDQFRQDIDVIHLQNRDRLFFYTDGIEEARNSNGEMFGTQRFQRLFAGDPNLIFNKIIDSKSDFIGSANQDDDITLVEVIYDEKLTSVTNESIVNKNPQVDSQQAAIDWEMEFLITPEEIKSSDPLAQVIKFLNNAIHVANHQDYISTILSELFNNALDHGLLDLDSDVKKTEDGFVEYYLDRRKKIDALNSGSITIELSYVDDAETDGLLMIVMTDSGKGFDFKRLQNEAVADVRGYGHGLQLIDSLCENMSFTNAGSTVTAIYKIPH